jgi:histidine triad (HIT) family protein
LRKDKNIHHGWLRTPVDGINPVTPDDRQMAYWRVMRLPPAEFDFAASAGPHRMLPSGHYDRGVPDCLFCGIAAGAIPATTVLDGKRVIAFRDITPQAPTHVLVIPRDHYPDVAALASAGDGLLDELVSHAHQVAVAEGVDGSGYRIVFNTGREGGQTVGHVHAHVLGGRPMTWPPG